MNKVEIFNLALSAVGTRNRISSPTETSSEARECALWYDSVRRQVLCAAPFQEATRVVRLALQAERADGSDWTSTDPDPGWRFSYSTPNDMLRPRFTSQYEPFIISVSSTNEKRITTNVEDAILVYTFDQTNIDMWSANLQNAVIYGLAASICMKLTGARLEIFDRLVQQANSLLGQARTYSGNIDENPIDSIPPWLSARGVPSAQSRYVYPYGPMFVGSP